MIPAMIAKMMNAKSDVVSKPKNLDDEAIRLFNSFDCRKYENTVEFMPSPFYLK
jgi:hypothetical protein